MYSAGSPKGRRRSVSPSLLPVSGNVPFRICLLAVCALGGPVVLFCYANDKSFAVKRGGKYACMQELAVSAVCVVVDAAAVTVAFFVFSLL